MLSGSRAATTLIVSTMVLAAIQMQTASSVAAAAKSNSSDMIDVEGSEAFTSKDLRLSEVESLSKKNWGFSGCRCKNPVGPREGLIAPAVHA